MKSPAIDALEMPEAFSTLGAPEATAGRAPALPALFWLILPLVAMWPVWRWSALRLTDGSDDPLGIIAILALGPALYRDRDRFGAVPRMPWLIASMLLAAMAAFGAPVLPWLLRGVLAVASLVAMIGTLKGARQPMLPYWGLGFLALPLLSSLQFFVGYPLRVVTAQASAWLLELAGIAALREGSSMTVNSRLVIVDAPCSGIQMAWFAYFTACVAACWLRLPDRIFLRRLPLIGLTVLLGNVARNTILVAKEAELLDWPAWTHEATGVVIFAAVCLLVLRRVAASHTDAGTPPLRYRSPKNALPHALPAAALCFTLIACTPMFFREAPSSTAAVVAVEWPREANGRRLRPLALSDVEQNFAAQFPGAIARLTDGKNLYTLRHITQPTRKLHPSADCFRGLGYHIGRTWLERRALLDEPATPLARCFIAEKGGQEGAPPLQWRVCEYIADTGGKSYSDTSSWYWSALFKQTNAPWQAVTVATPL